METPVWLQRKISKVVDNLTEVLTKSEIQDLVNGKAFLDVTEKKIKTGGAEYSFQYKQKTVYYLKKNHKPLITSKNENAQMVIDAIDNKLSVVHGHFLDDQKTTFVCCKHEFSKIFSSKPSLNAMTTVCHTVNIPLNNLKNAKSN